MTLPVKAHKDDPAGLGFPRSLALEVAMAERPVAQIFEDYGLNQDDWNRLRFDTAFKEAVVEFRKELETDGVSFRTKAKMQAEEMLKTSWKIIHDEDTPAHVRADLIKSTVRWAGYEQKPGVDGALAAGGPGFQINIIMNDAHND